MVHMIEFDDYEVGFAKDVLSYHIFRRDPERARRDQRSRL
jgi:hypothetical protein